MHGCALSLQWYDVTWRPGDENHTEMYEEPVLIVVDISPPMPTHHLFHPPTFELGDAQTAKTKVLCAAI
jgi:hypothetical protein